MGREDDPGRRFENASCKRSGERGKGGAEPAAGSPSPVLEVLESPALLGRTAFVKHAAPFGLRLSARSLRSLAGFLVADGPVSGGADADHSIFLETDR